MSKLFWILLLTGTTGSITSVSGQNFLDKFAEGFNLLTRLFGLEAKSIFDLFQKHRDKGKLGDQGSNNSWTEFLSSWAFYSDNAKLALVNGMTFLIEVISKSFIDIPNQKNGKSKHSNQNLLEIAMAHPQISRFLTTMKDRNLMDHVLVDMDSKLNDNDEECVQRLVCSIKPIVKGMQNSLWFTTEPEVKMRQQVHLKGELDSNESNTVSNTTAQWRNTTPLERFYFFMPSFDVVKENFKFCQRKYPICNLITE